jgi:hypothetical protein
MSIVPLDPTTYDSRIRDLQPAVWSPRTPRRIGCSARASRREAEAWLKPALYYAVTGVLSLAYHGVADLMASFT